LIPAPDGIESNALVVKMVEEYSFTCPYCWEQITMILDLSAGGQSYVEDCEVCCNPIVISYEVEDGRVAAFEAGSAQD